MAQSSAEAVNQTTGCKPGVEAGSVEHLSSVKQLRFGISFAEYMHYASITRAREKVANDEYLRERGPTTLKCRIKDMLKTGRQGSQELEADSPYTSEKDNTGQKDHSVVQTLALDSTAPSVQAPPSELHTANRALRTAGWGSMFYLITLDIMGPSNTP